MKTKPTTRHELSHYVKHLIAETDNFLSEDMIKDEHNLKNELNVDSMEKAALIFRIEDDLSIRMRDSDITEIKTVKDLINTIEDYYL